MEKYSPVRVVADSMLRLPLTSRLVRSAREVPVWVLAGTDAPQDAEFKLLASGVEVLRSPESTDPLNLKDALEFLAAKGITRLMVEGGPTLAARLYRRRSRRRGHFVPFCQSGRRRRHRCA